MKMLAAPATVLALWAVSAQAATNDDIAKRLEPVGQVCVQGQECKGMEVAATAGGGGAKTPDEIIAKHCNACHGTGLLGAPKNRRHRRLERPRQPAGRPRWHPGQGDHGY